MNRNDDQGTQNSPQPIPDDQTNQLNQEDLRREERDLLGLNQDMDDDQM